MSNVKNYTEQGGAKTVIGGALEIQEGASVTGLPTPGLTAATAAALGGVKAEAKSETDTVAAKIGADAVLYVPTYPVVPAPLVLENQAASTAADAAALLLDFNALLAKLKSTGIMAADPEA